MTNQVDRGSREDDQKLVKKIKNYIYDPAQIIGSGFSSNVYKGLNQLNGETIAIKVLELSKIQSEVEKYLLNNEINALRALSHPHVLRTVEILMTKNNVYIMTEYCQNGDLQQYVRKQSKLTELEALHLIRDVAEGYLAIEEKRIVHRDMKTANIFLTPKGARIADFGFCEFLNETKKPQMFYNVGSPAYMSPESYRDNHYSAKSDVWSMGIILYEMLVGETPDKNLSYSEMSANLMAGRISSGNNEEIRKILAGCFKRDLKERWSPAQFLEAVASQIFRLESGGRQPMRQQAINPAVVSSTNLKKMENGFMQPSPSEISPNRQNQNRHMVSSNLPAENSGGLGGRSQSPFKTRFVNQLGQEPSSPLKPFRGRDESLHRISNRQSNKIKSMTEMLLFLYRTLNLLGETNLEGASFIRLILFRHRNHLESSVERLMTAEKLDRSNYEPFKEFQYLKSRFDQAYLQKESQPNSPPLPTPVLSKLNELSNQLFTDTRSILTYCSLTLEASQQCERLVNGRLDPIEGSKVGALWDYLMIHFEILQLYSQGQTIERISQQTIGLASILRDQPRKLNSKHFQLLRCKLQMIQEFFQIWSGELGGQERGSQQMRIQQIPERKYLIQNGFF